MLDLTERLFWLKHSSLFVRRIDKEEETFIGLTAAPSNEDCATTFSITTLGIMTHSVKGLYVTLNIDER